MRDRPSFPRSVLIVQTGFLGDAALASGMIRALSTGAPGMRIGLLVRSGFTDLYRDHPGITALHGFDKKKSGGSREAIDEIRAADYDVALLPHRSLRSVLIAARAGIARRTGFRQSEGRLFLTERVEYGIGEREIDRNARLIERLGIPTHETERRGWLVPGSEELERMRSRFAAIDRPVAVAPGSVWPTKRWPEERYVGLVRALRERGARVLLIGSGEEAEACRRIAEAADVPGEDLLAGALSLRELVALLAIVDRVFCNDSAPLHIAECVGTPASAVFGPTVAEFGFAPYLPASSVVSTPLDLPCRPCGIHGDRSCPVGTHACMTTISIESVLDTWRE